MVFDLVGIWFAPRQSFPKLDVAGSTPVARSKLFKGLHLPV